MASMLSVKVNHRFTEEERAAVHFVQEHGENWHANEDDVRAFIDQTIAAALITAVDKRRRALKAACITT